MKIFPTLSIVLLLSTPISFSAAADEVAPLPANVLQAARSRIAAGEYPVLVIAVVDGKQSGIYGFGKLADGKAPDGDTVFEIGSVTKTFTGLLLANAIETGIEKPDEPIAQVLPQLTIPSRNGKFITLGNLATQYSGLPRLPDNMKPSDVSNPYADYDAGKLKAFLTGYALPRDPGSRYEYSNLGFGLLGYALAAHAHESYGELVSNLILQPLDMSMSGTELSPSMRAHLAAGHDGTGKVTENWDWTALAGAGAIKSTGADMLRYLEANMGILKTSLYPAMQLAQEPRADVSGNEKIGFAWMTQTSKDGSVIWHNGMTGGYASFIGFTADGSRGVVVLTNIEQTVDDVGFATLLPETKLAATEKIIRMTPEELDAYTGIYQLAPQFNLTIFRQGDQLCAQATGQGVIPIFSGAKDTFFAKIADIRISFQHGESGSVSGLVLHQNGDYTAPRIRSSVAQKSQ